jgi:tyrosyl-tRNA synthetase
MNLMDQITEVLTRGVANIIPGRDEFEKVLRSDRKLNIYLGIDPTATRIHIGHAVPLRKLQQLSELGHHITFLIGDFTALIGDTSDKDGERPVLTAEQIEANFQTYKQQAAKVLDFSQVSLRHNSEWLGKLDFGHIIKLTRNFSLNDFISRELIKKRLADGRSVSLPEVLYPVMQGYDSYFMDTDLQIGGTDQTFNMQAGRTLQKNLRNKESFVMSLEFLTGTDGRKMSKSWGNAIWIEDPPEEMYGKAMSLKDDLLIEYFTLATGVTIEKVHEVSARLDAAENPMTLKKELALQIVSEMHSRADAFAAQTQFEKTVQNREVPDNIPTQTVTTDNIVDILVETGLVASKSSARRLIEQGGVKANNEKITSYDVPVSSGTVVSVGSRNFVRIER